MQDPVSRDTLLRAMAPVIKSARQRLGLSQERLAECVALTTEYMARIERGRALPSLETFVFLADALGVSADELLGTMDIEQQPARDPTTGAEPELARLAMSIMSLDRLGRVAVLAVLRALEAHARRRTE